MLKGQVVAQIEKAIGVYLRANQRASASTEVEVFQTENPAHGHYSTNVAMRMARRLKRPPLEIADEIAAALNQRLFEKIEVARPGFVNFWISREALQSELNAILEKGERYGEGSALHGKKIMIEYTDPNPFKAFHIGHLYTNMIGEALARLFEAQGADVRRANYQGDVGIHVAKAVWGLQKKLHVSRITFQDLERKPLKERIEFMGQAYAEGARAFEEDAAAKEEITDLNKKIYDLDPEIKEVYERGRVWSLEYFETIYKRLGTKFDFYYFERDVGKIGLQAVEENLKKGVFEESEGAVVFPGEKYGLHRRVFINSRGLPTYEAKDLGLAPQKFNDFPYDLSIVVTANEITDYFKVVLAALGQIRPDLAEKTKHLGHGFVRLQGGKMSSRTGTVVSAEELLDAVKQKAKVLVRPETPAKDREGIAEHVALAAVKYAFLKTNIGQDIVFDAERSLDLKGDSGPYLQYAYARLWSVLQKAGETPKQIYLSAIEEEEEKNLVRQLIYFPETAARAAELYEPNILAGYLYKLATVANTFYEKAPILTAGAGLREARLALAAASMAILKKGLCLLGITAPERM